MVLVVFTVVDEVVVADVDVVDITVVDVVEVDFESPERVYFNV